MKIELPDDGLVPAAVAAAFLSIPKHQLYAAARRGLIPSVRLGRRVRFSARALRGIA